MSDQRNANEIKIAESLLAIEERLGRIEGENLFAIETIVDRLEQDQLPHIEGRLAVIEKQLDDLKIVLEILSRHIIREKDDAPKIAISEEGDVRRRSGEVDTWHPEKGGG